MIDPPTDWVWGWGEIGYTISRSRRWVMDYHHSGKEPRLPIRYLGREPYASRRELQLWLAGIPYNTR